MPESIKNPSSPTENTHIRDLTPIPSPLEIKSDFPASPNSIATVTAGREAVKATLQPNSNNRLVVVSGPCSIHDTEAALKYSEHISAWREEYGEDLEILMRMYFEKPRTTVGWKGLINDPSLDGSFDIISGLRTARSLAVDITDTGVPVATEILDNMTPQYFAGLISWGAIGARTTESQSHRELASGLSFPIGFKNGTSGNVQVAVDAVSAAAHPHNFLAITNEGLAAKATTTGNPDTHVVLRGGADGPNYSDTEVADVTDRLSTTGLNPVVMIDASHQNSRKNHKNQIVVLREVARQLGQGSTAIMGVMIESNLVEGAQPFNPGGKHEFGKSITDACVGLGETEEMLGLLADAVKARRT